MREVEALLEKAERSFAAADLLLDAGDACTWRKGYCSRRACDTRATARSWPSTGGTLPARAASITATTVSLAEHSSSGS